MKDKTFMRVYAYVGTVYLAISFLFLLFIYFRSEDIFLLIVSLCFILLVLLLGCLFLHIVRTKLSAITEDLCVRIDNMMNDVKDITTDFESETLVAKLNFKLKRLYQIHLQNGEQLKREKQVIQEMISDISHQVKTPIANLKMYNSTLMEQQLAPERENEFLSLMDMQINKLDFLMQSMIKTSRLETGIIVLEAKPTPVYSTIARALGGIVLPAEKKDIDVSISCDQAITIPHDAKWTAEALFNILDNAVKYTEPGGKIKISVEKWKIYTKISISDTGRGIPEEHYAQIFKRFYREEEVHEIPGVGIGLYLCREIITLEGGYIEVKSRVRRGSTFSIFLPNERQF